MHWIRSLRRVSWGVSWGRRPKRILTLLIVTTHKKSKKSRKKERRKRRAKNDRPIPPTPYDGSPDPEALTLFIQEAEQYLKAAGISRRDEVYRVARFLKGEARRFYVQNVSSNYKDWSLTQFYDELFNWCFPRDYRTDIRRKIAKCFQGSRRCRDYVQVLKLWRGLRSSIQST
ncbi:hypothetical protein IW262DRAFT_1367299 [Armillaria fumosa]|nr:hypothetical protein IW262DRAFT_1367299 [Armillaria fumosa]